MSSSKGGSRSSSGSNSNVFPSAGRELLLELKRSSVSSNTGGGSSSYLPPYNTKLTRACLMDLKDSVQTLKDIVQTTTATNENEGPSMSSRPSILFHQASIQRNKRCLLAYHKHRMDQLMKNSSQYYHNVITNVTTTGGGTGTASTSPSQDSPNNDNVGQQQQQQKVIDNTANNNLHPLEIQFIKEYYELRQLYAETVDIDTMLGYFRVQRDSCRVQRDS